MEILLEQIEICVALLRTGNISEGIENVRKIISQIQTGMLNKLEQAKQNEQSDTKELENEIMEAFKKIIDGIEYQDTILLADTLEYCIKKMMQK